MKQLTKQQQQIIYVAAGSVVFILLFWMLIFAPASRKLSQIKQKLSSTENQIADITKITQGKDLSEVVAKLNKDLVRFASKLPLRQEIVMNYLSDNARRSNIDVKNIVLSEKQVVKEGVAGLEIDETLISMALTGDFRSLGEFLNSLTHDDSILIVLKQLNISGTGEGRSKLDISLKVNAYLAKEAIGN
ncbi:MAG: type 4a pilus biogenesis protein PilO [Candidatus Omnitrophota bacterium]|jgi:Tfp pilus assembly protein PilO